MLHCKVFQSRDILKLERIVNDWLLRQPIILRDVQFSSVEHNETEEYWMVYTVIVFYEEMIAV